MHRGMEVGKFRAIGYMRERVHARRTGLTTHPHTYCTYDIYLSSHTHTNTHTRYVYWYAFLFVYCVTYAMYTQFFFVCILCNICYVHTKRAVYTHNTCSVYTQHVQCLQWRHKPVTYAMYTQHVRWSLFCYSDYTMQHCRNKCSAVAVGSSVQGLV
jgi:hypothetical protein